MTKPILKTQRLIIRKFTLEDVQAILDFENDPRVQQYTGEPPLESIESARAMLTNKCFRDYREFGYGRWAVVHKVDNRVIGFAGLKYLKELDETDVGFRFLPEYWQQGIATEACKAILQYGIDHFKLSRIIGITMPENKASGRVLEKSGMHLYRKGDYDGDGEMYHWYKIEK